jgi:tyrosyl-tRNA synthetase
MSLLGESVARVAPLLAGDLSAPEVVEALLAETEARRHLDLSDLAPRQQAELIAARAVNVLPSVDGLAELITTAGAEGRQLIVKFGIDPTSADVHLGHAVPMLVLSRFQRMGHRVVLLIGDITAKIGDPSGRSSERPPLTDQEIAANMATYRDQIAPFFDFERADFRHNSEWLTDLRLPELIGILSQIPVSMSLQREDFRTRLAQGQGLAMSEFLYSVVMAIDSVKLDADVELGGVDQLLNMQMGRKVMDIVGQRPQFVVGMPLAEGTDGTGRKMSKSMGNYISLAAPPDDIFGKIMSVPDRLIAPYLRAWTDWTDGEIDAATARVERRDLHPMDLKRVLAGEMVGAIHGVKAAMAARDAFAAQFSRRTFAELDELPVVELAASGDEPVAKVLTQLLEFTPSLSAARRLAKQGGLRIVLEVGGEQRNVPVDEAGATGPLRDAVAAALAAAGRQPGDAQVYLRAGRRLARIR